MSLIRTIMLLNVAFGVINCQYQSETPEEEYVPNRIDEVSRGFVCQGEGYFADIAHGCQFYHVCENSNNPYDKASFVKHTFSCINGTVFNQRSFTCTREQDSIPCEQSSNYFYLNKRNGDPKAFFLTDDDIFKDDASSYHKKHHYQSQQPQQQQHRQHQQQQQQVTQYSSPSSYSSSTSSSSASSSSVSPSSSSQPQQYQQSSTNFQAYKQHQPQNHLSMDLHSLNGRPATASAALSALIGSSSSSSHNVPRTPFSQLSLTVNKEAGQTLPAESDDYSGDYDPNPIRIYKYEPKNMKFSQQDSDNSALEIDYSKSSSKYQNLPEIPEKYLTHASLTQARSQAEPDLQRVPMMSDKNKYEVFEPSTLSNSKAAIKYNSYEPNYEEDYPIEQEVPPQTQPKSMPQMSHSSSAPSPDDSSSTYRMVQPMSYRPIMEPSSLSQSQPELSQKYSPQAQMPSTPSAMPLSLPQAHEPEMMKKSQIYTPGEFTRLYIESQKAKYLEENPRLIPKSVSGNDAPSSGYNSFYYGNQQEARQSNYEQTAPVEHTANPSPRTQLTYTTHASMPMAEKPKQRPLALPAASRYEPADMVKNVPSQSENNFMVPPDRYIGPDGRETSEIPKTQTEIIELPPLSVEDASKPENGKNKHFLDSLMDPMQPVKMTFVNRAELAKKPYEQFGDNVRVVKQVKGKSLLIDPTLENDPARDSIIAQVLEMLNKYN